MNELEWRENNLPVSTRFDDPYYSKEDGRAETDHVFIQGNRLPERWPLMKECTIAELGFGTGLNFLETVRQWNANQNTNSKLHFISFEQFPISKDDMQKALSPWQTLGSLREDLTGIWQPTQTIDKALSETVRLTVYMGDANHILSNLSLRADAWFLDGFSPAKNPELWNTELLEEVGKNTVAGGTFATYTAAGFVKRNLKSAGFEVTKVKGFGRKRDMLIGTKRNDIDVA